MAHLKQNLLRVTNCLLSFVLAMLGFTGCSEEGGDMYGQPYATFQISGHVTDEDGNALEEKRIIVRNLICGEENAYMMSDTLATEEKGNYLWKKKIGIDSGKLRVVCQDPKEEFKADSVEIDIELTEKGKDFWNMGSGQKTVNFELQKKGE